MGKMRKKKSKSKINEATLEANLNYEVKRIFPTLGRMNISHQTSFSITLGRKTYKVNGKENYKAYGRLDALIKIDDKPFLLMELKKPDLKLSKDDKEQGISYARLLTPMPPLVVITNGMDCEFYTTIDSQEWVPNNIDEEAVKAIFENAAECAVKDIDDSAKFLLGKQPEIWKKIIEEYTKNIIEDISGSLTDSTKPLINGLSIKRSIAGKLLNAIKKRKELVVLLGAPLSGKTNVINQICIKSHENNIIPLYVEAGSLDYGIIQHLANQLAKNLFRVTTGDQIRQWLLSNFQNSTKNRFLIIIDGLSANTNDQIKADINELIDLSDGKRFSLLLAMDENTFNLLSTSAGRSTLSLFGRKASAVKLEPLSDYEMTQALKDLKNKYNISFNNGVFYNTEYRQPRMIRILASYGEKTDLGKELDKPNIPLTTTHRLQSVSSIDVLQIAWNIYMSDPEIKEDFNVLAEAYISDRQNRETNQSISLFSFGRGIISLKCVESVVTSDRYKRLKENGFISIIDGPEGKVFVLPKVPEMLSASAVYVISDKIKKLQKQNKDEALILLLRETESFPLPEVVAAKAILEICKSDISFLTGSIFSFLENEPKFSSMNPKSAIMMRFPDTNEIRMTTSGMEGETIYGNIHPWLILSHIAAFPLDSQDGEFEPNLKIFKKVGNFKNILRRPDIVPIKKIKGLHLHDLADNTTVLCGKVGIIEPITQALFVGFHTYPFKMLELSQFAIENNKLPLIFRLNIAAQQSITSVDKKVAISANDSKKLIDTYFKKVNLSSMFH